jgi:hypothetical protein
LDPQEITIEILDFTEPYKNDDTSIVYKIKTSYQTDLKTWEIERSFAEFEAMQKILVDKYSSTPFLPCKALLRLNEREKGERKDHLQSYLRVNSLPNPIINKFKAFSPHQRNFELN